MTAAEKESCYRRTESATETAKEEHKKHVAFGKENESCTPPTMKQNAKDIATAQKVLDSIQSQLEALAA